jgi:hypothetical protein
MIQQTGYSRGKYFRISPQLRFAEMTGACSGCHRCRKPKHQQPQYVRDLNSSVTYVLRLLSPVY